VTEKKRLVSLLKEGRGGLESSRDNVRVPSTSPCKESTSIYTQGGIPTRRKGRLIKEISMSRESLSIRARGTRSSSRAEKGKLRAVQALKGKVLRGRIARLGQDLDLAGGQPRVRQRSHRAKPAVSIGGGRKRQCG